MNKLSNITYSTELTVVEKQSLMAFEMPKIKDLAKTDMVDMISDAISRAYININQSADKDNPKNDLLIKRQMASSLINDLKDSFGTFSVEEVCLAIDMGSKGKLNNLTEIIQPVMSLTNILAWIWLYRDKIRREAQHKQKEYEEKEAKKQEQIDHLAKMLDFETVIIGRYNGFPDSLLNDNYGVKASYYRHLDKLKLFDLPIEKKKELFDKAVKIKEANESEMKAEYEALFQMGKQEREERGKTRILRIEFTEKEIAESLALDYLFDFWQFEGYNLKEALQFTEPK